MSDFFFFSFFWRLNCIGHYWLITSNVNTSWLTIITWPIEDNQVHEINEQNWWALIHDWFLSMGGDLALGLGDKQKSFRYRILRCFKPNFGITFLDKNLIFHPKFLMTFLEADHNVEFICFYNVFAKYLGDVSMGPPAPETLGGPSPVPLSIRPWVAVVKHAYRPRTYRSKFPSKYKHSLSSKTLIISSGFNIKQITASLQTKSLPYFSSSLIHYISK